MKHPFSIRRLVYAALFCAMICAATLVVQIPLPTGYVHPGDALCLLAGFLLPAPSAAVAAGLGSALADLFSGYAVYAPATFVIKAGIALLAHFLLRLFLHKHTDGKHLWMGSLAGAFAGELFMIGGYFAFEALLYGSATALLTLLGNAGQGAFGILIAVPLCRALHTRLKID
jgi:uncharacterized membrane protein